MAAETADRLREMEDGFGHWLAGFADGEGCFQVIRTVRASGGEKFHCAFRLAVRCDDEPIIREIQRRTEIGVVYVMAKPGGQDQASWNVHRKAECAFLVEIFQTYPLRAKKARDCAIWTEAVRAWERIDPRHANWGELAQLRVSLIGTRQFVPIEVPDYDDPQQVLDVAE